jgi:hypothetical protein
MQQLGGQGNLWRLPRDAAFDVAQYTAAVKAKFPSRRSVVVNFTLKGVKCDVVALHAAVLEAGGIDEVWVPQCVCTKGSQRPLCWVQLLSLTPVQCMPLLQCSANCCWRSAL